ncbi:MAG: DUF2779 domain-containing protein [Bdellovibrionales bacterium]|nr:DUF2779 domain-containing protein [Bdellovibrionales bacterium]
MSIRYLTKSRFKIGFECPTKLFFLDDPAYGNTNVDNSFLKALAEGGFQVGELAKVYHPGGVEVETLDKVEAVKQTNELLKQKNVIIFEAAIQHQNLFIRADVLIKKGDSIEIVEVKAKSYDPHDEDQFYNKTQLKNGVKKLSSSWEPYLIDVAFQCYVVRSAFPSATVSGSLMLADKSATASVDGINQKIFLEKSADGRASARVAAGVTKESLGAPLLICVPVPDEIDVVWGSTYEVADMALPFPELVEFLADTCVNRSFIKPVVGSQCKSCEFRIDQSIKDQGKKSGFEHCWQTAMNLKPADFERQFIFDIWNFRKSADLIESGVLFMDQLSEDDISPSKSSGAAGLSASERQWLQVEKVKAKDTSPFIDMAGLAREFSSWTYPLHFIDFETTMVAIPFHKGRRPYEQIAFQFSHHRVEKDGTIAHVDEYFNRDKGKFPNFDFVRALKRSLEGDCGTIFRYAAHENTVLNQIKEQLLSWDEQIDDRDELVQFIESITSYSKESRKNILGPRCMIDLCDLVKKHFYHPEMRGSNSIKKVLPAILNSSEFLKEKYQKPIYGALGGIRSLNFQDWKWIEVDGSGAVKDPYLRLPPIFSDLDLEEMDSLIMDGSIADGGAAMTAYSRMQFTEMTAAERERVANALLKYCELDTLAMVMIWEYWNHEIEKVLGRGV